MTLSRSAALATVVVGGRNMTFISTHLDNLSAETRALQLQQLLTWASGFAEPRMIAGDFNMQPGPELDPIRASYADGWTTGLSTGVATTFADNPDGYTFGLTNLIDYAWTAGSSLTVTSIAVLDTRNAAGMFASDHNPIVAVYEIK
jgi:endonuclease/exonuclease/phosphatase family metal-dependent hydrolase